MNHRIKRARPAAALDVDAGFGVAARREGPDDIIDAGRVDVVIHDNRKAILVSARKTLRCDQPGLLGVPRIALLNRNHGKLARAGFVRPDAANIRNTGSFQFFPNVSGACDRA